ncbi:MAG: peptidyl-prolyl cis-trans isomerase [Myxococcales bacterium]|nr:peptidyl-prolyl cis-trans isomerase [Myxococcales bacterium]
MWFLRAPLLQFFLVGALLLFAHHLLQPSPRTRIRVSAEEKAGLLTDFGRRTGRAPSDSEQQQIVDAYLDSEVLYREALVRHLDRGDVIIRRRLIQKMDFVLDALANGQDAAPSEAELEAYYQSHAERYRQPARVSLWHVFVARDEKGEAAAVARAEALRLAARSGADPAKLGDPFVRGARFVEQTESELASVFGLPFARAVFALPVDTLSQPIASSYGLHIVRTTALLPAVLPPLSAMKARVAQDLNDELRRRTRLRLLRGLRQGYDIAVP